MGGGRVSFAACARECGLFDEAEVLGWGRAEQSCQVWQTGNQAEIGLRLPDDGLLLSKPDWREGTSNASRDYQLVFD